MAYLIAPNFFAPKHPSYIDGSPNSHGIQYNRCSFNCRYCNFPPPKDAIHYVELDRKAFSETIDRLLPLGQRFKFTGGEPTLDKQLIPNLEITKQAGGIVFLDTNGSRPDVLKRCIEDKLVDVVGLSIKGLTPDEALWMSQANSTKYCWDNVLESIRICAECNIDTLLTYVCYADFCECDLAMFVSLVKNYPKLYIKINSWVPFGNTEFFGKEPPRVGYVDSVVESFLRKYPVYANRFVLIENPKAVSDGAFIGWK